FDGIDTSLPGLVSRLGTEAAKAPFLDPKLADLVRLISQAEAAFTPDNPARTATPLLAGVGLVSGLISQVESSDLSAAAKLDLLTELRTKREQFQKAANLALGLDLEVNVDAPAKAASQPVDFPAPERTFMMAVPGETFTLTAHLYNRSNRPVMAEDIRLDVPKGWAVELLKKDFKTMKADDSSEAQFKVTVPEDASYTRPYWHRDSTQSDTLYTIDQPEYVNLPFPPYPMKATAVYSLAGAAGEVSSIPKVKYIDPIYGQEERPLAVGPPITLELQPATQVVATAHQGEDDVTVGVRNDVNGPATATLKLELPNGWTAQPPSVQMTFSREGEFASYKFRVKPGRLREDRYKIKAVVDYGGRQYSEGYKVVTREDLDSFYYYHPAVQELSAVSVKTPPALKVGYIMGAGDDIPQVLTQLGIDVAIITPSELASGDLTRYGTIVLGIRAYDVRSDVKDNNQRLLDYVSRGGTLVVQYNQSVQAFNAGTFTPYPMTASTKRVTVEQAPVQILVPDDSIFHFPNEIGSSDFEGWVQERGVYFMEKWDPRFKALMASNDPGEAPLPGGLLRASYGKGTYIYTGYVFFRELPAGVPGAVRLFVNILAAGHEGR
ncbi:MAG TPA: NEW3 domain-containing protein, partial [Blastocatellia bacterium]|nr:NEW3 domain-containing protein [Blastocatellia bacterium]